MGLRKVSPVDVTMIFEEACVLECCREKVEVKSER